MAIKLSENNQRDMTDAMFDGNIAGEMTLGEAIVRGILNPPKYVLSIYSYSKDLEKYEKCIHTVSNKAVRNEAVACLDALHRVLENAEGLDETFEKHMTARRGKYIIFTPDHETMQRYIKLADEWFGRIDKDAHIYSVYSGEPSASKSFRDFKDDNSDHLRLMYCTGDLNKCIHAENISGVILFRSASSPLIYKLQLRRALSALSTEEPVIFDIVNNIEALYSIDSVKEETNDVIEYYRSHGKNNLIVNDTFEIIDKLAKCKELFEQLEVTLTAAWDTMYEAAEKYYLSAGSLDPPQRFVTDDGIRLGAWLTYLRKHRKRGLQSSYLTPERIAQLDRLGMVWDVYDYVFERNYHAAVLYYREHENLECSTDHVTSDGIRLGAWLCHLRAQHKKNPDFLTDEQYAILNAIGMRWGNKYDLQWDEAYSELCEYYRIHKTLSVPAAYKTEKGTLLGKWIRRQIESYAKGQLRSDRIERLEKLGIVWDTFEERWQQMYRSALLYYRQNNNLKVPPRFRTDTGKDLYEWLLRQRKLYKAEKLCEKKIRLLKQIGFIFEIETAAEIQITGDNRRHT